jgi:hypothetical protein
MDWDRGAVSGAKSIAGSMGLSDRMIYIEIRRSLRNRELMNSGSSADRARSGLKSDAMALPKSATLGRTWGQSEADIRAVTRLTIRGSRRALDRFTRWVTSLMI